MDLVSRLVGGGSSVAVPPSPSVASTTKMTPHLVATKMSKQLMVKGKPFLMLAAELQNSSLTSAAYMSTVWQKMRAMHINTLLGCVTWEMIEPTEGRFDFAELDKVVLDARKNDLHLILLWFGSFKNGISTYAPGWVKTNSQRFPRAKLSVAGRAGKKLRTGDVVSLFHPECRQADARAFGKLMEHLKAIDESHSTVLMVQVENETGLLGDSRDRCRAAEERFAASVPDDLLAFLHSEWDSLHPDLVATLADFKTKAKTKTSELSGKSWEQVFGASAKTDELFMAYHYAAYLETVAAAGKASYDIPLYTNVWMNYVGADADNAFPVVAGGGGNPGDYPSGGAVSNVLDVWQRFAPSLDFISPDVYLNDYDASCAKYRHRGQPLFIPEQRRDEYGARRAWIAYGSHSAIGVSPFGIDTLEPETCAYTRHYGLLERVSGLVLAAQRDTTDTVDSMVGFCFDELEPDGTDMSRPVVRRWGGYEITIERCFVFGQPGPGAGMVIHRGGGVFLLIGWGFQVRARALSEKATFTGFLRFEEKEVVDVERGMLRTARVLNGDETRSGVFAMMPNEEPDYGGFPICVTIPARTMVAELEVYHLEEPDE